MVVTDATGVLSATALPTNGTAVLNGTTNPIATTGANGDFYINTATNTIFGPKAGGAWLATGTSLVGATGAQGPIGLTGATGPQGIQGVDGAVGPQGPIGLTGAAGTNGTNGTNGIDGKTVLNGTTNPIATTGANGDFYINTATNTLFGPKTAGAWLATGTSLVGATGAQGIPGVAGATGATGPQGPAGADGVGGVTNAGTNVTITGAGTTASPYVVNSAIETATQTPSDAIVGSETKVAVASTNVQGAIDELAMAVKSASNNLYVADGILSGNRTVTQGSNTLGFTSTATTGTSHFSVDNSTLSVDAVNNKVGIGSTAPFERLSVSGGNIGIDYGNGIVVNGTTYTKKNILTTSWDGTNDVLSLNAPGSAAASKIRFSTNIANGTLAERLSILPNGDVIVSEKLGIGTTVPLANLHIKSSGTSNAELNISTSTENSSAILNLTTPFWPTENVRKAAIIAKGISSSSRSDLHFVLNSDSNTSNYVIGTDTKMIIKNSGEVGIGTSSPSQKLTVSGGALISSLAGTGSRMVVADATGVLSTQNLPATADGSETKVNAGTNVTVTGAGTTASPYVVNATGASDATTTTNGIVRLAGDLSGTAAAPAVANLAINTAKLADNAVTSAKIVDGTIATADLSDGAITAAKLNAMSATSGQVLKYNGTVWAPAADAGLTTTTVSNSITSGALTTTVNGVAATAVTLPVADGSETKVNAGTNVTITGSGTTASPYVVNSAIETATETPSSAIVGSATQVTVASTNVQGALGDLATAVKTAGNNLYTADGTLIGNRTVTMGANSLTFTGTGPIVFNGSNVSSNSENTAFSWDAGNNNRLGIVKKTGSTPFFAAGSGTPLSFQTANASNINSVATTSYTERMKIDPSGTVVINSLAGTGNRMVVADAIGVLSTQNLPVTADGSETKVNAGTNVIVTGAGTTASPYVVAADSSIVTLTASTTATSSNSTILCDVPVSGMTLTLPSAATNTGKKIVIRKIDNDSDVLTFSPALNYSTTSTITTLNFIKTITVQSNGTSWWIISE
jgi:hypothetical protein